MPSKSTIETTPYGDQKPGTSGLRKKTKVFLQPNYLANFVQATLNVVPVRPDVLVVGGDGRYYGLEAAQTIIKIGAANGIREFWVGQHALLSTPAVSAVIRTRDAERAVSRSAFVLTASHNPGGIDEDFGIKYNYTNGGPAPEAIMAKVAAESAKLTQLHIVRDLPDVDLTKVGKTTFDVDGASVVVEVIDPVEDYVKLLSTVFDFAAIERLIARPDFSFVYDAMHGVAGPYAKKVFVELLKADNGRNRVLNAEPKEDFGHGHPDPNLTYAPELVAALGLTRTGDPAPDVADPSTLPQFGAAADGDADRNMVLGRQFFVSPSDSVAVLAANANTIPFFASAGGLKAVARSMPTSGALDHVAKALNIPFFEVPTGWKFFGNLMDSAVAFGKADYNPLICGEESFGTGSNHVREKDGIWAVLAWLQVLAAHNADASKPLVTVEEIVTAHWKRFGRNYYSRYDYEGVDADAANRVMDGVRALKPEQVAPLGSAKCASVDDFEYVDPIDGSVSSRQGVRVLFADGSRFVLRLSGTGSSGATIRLYLEQYMSAADVAARVSAGTLPRTSDALAQLVTLALTTSKMAELTGRSEPTVIT